MFGSKADAIPFLKKYDILSKKSGNLGNNIATHLLKGAIECTVQVSAVMLNFMQRPCSKLSSGSVLSSGPW